MNNDPIDNKAAWKKRLFWRKLRLYLLWAVSFVVCLTLTFPLFNARFVDMIGPQITRAYVEIADQLPALTEDETYISKLYERISASRAQARADGISLPSDVSTNSALLADLQQNIEDAAAMAVESGNLQLDADEPSQDGSTPAPASDVTYDALNVLFSVKQAIWPKVGRNGTVVLVSRTSGVINAHPDDTFEGSPMMICNLVGMLTGGRSATRINESGDIQTVELSTFLTNPPKDLFKTNHYFVFPENALDGNPLWGLQNVLFASIVTHDDYYVICGVDCLEYFTFVAKALVTSILAWVLIWLFIYYICLLMERHEEDAKTLRSQLPIYAALLSIVIFGMSWYLQVLSHSTEDMLTMQKSADTSVATLSLFRSTQETINGWLDDQYLIQARIAAEYIKSMDRAAITRKDLAMLSDKLKVKHIYVYDQTGAVQVTNSPYDNFKLGEKDNVPSYAFRALLAGADHVVQPPMPDEVAGTMTQFIGVGLRNADDLADGFVQIAIDPAVRFRLTELLNVESVLKTAIIGLPEQMLAIDKKDLTVTATTGAAYVGMNITDLGITQEQLGSSYSGFFKYGDKTYYAGFGEGEDLYLMAFMTKPDRSAEFYIALKFALMTLVVMALIILLALLRYQEDVVDSAPEPEAPKTEAAPALTPAARTLAKLSLPAVQEKKGFETRWGTLDNKASMTPGMKVRRMALNLLVFFCAVIMIPLVFSKVTDPGNASGYFGLAYVISGHWEKGLNLFAVSSIVILLLLLSVFNTLATYLLHSIAKASDLRGETICLLLRSSLKYISVIAFIYYGLSRLGIPTQTLLASAGIITLAVSMGAKDLVGDIIAGFFILVEGKFKVGDYVYVGSWKGTVHEIGIHTTKVVSGNETKIFNNSNLRDIVNVAPVETRDMTLSVPVDVNTSLADIEAMLAEELPRLESEIPGLVSAPKYEGIDKLEDGCMFVRISIEAKTGKHSAASRELNRQVKLMFERRGIEIPVKQLYVRQIEGASPVSIHEEAVSNGKEKA